MSLPTPRKRKQRADVACDFCRQRKLGCDNAKPKCENCNAYCKECSYSVPSRKKRTSASQNNIHSIDTAAKENQIIEVSETSKNDKPASNPRLSYFHGPTSSMFDGEDLSKHRCIDISAAQKSHLLAEAARQRQLEPINLRLGKLDLDGLDSDHAMRLLSVFWSRQHAYGSVVYRPCFMRDMASGGLYFSPLLLNAMFFVATKNCAISPSQCDTENADGPGTRFRRKVERILYDPVTQSLTKSSIPTIQALLLMADGLFSWCDESSLSWHYLGIATNMIIDLGIHSKKSKSKTPEDMEINRRVFWAAFVLDKIQSIYQGRTPRLRSSDCGVPIEFLDAYEELEPFDPVGYSGSSGLGDPTHSVSTFEHLCKLSLMTDQILSSLYVESSLEGDPDALFQTSQSLHADLMRWRESMPAHLIIQLNEANSLGASYGSVSLPHNACLMLIFYTLLILLHRPFISEGHLNPAATNARDEFSICRSAADNIDVILRWYRTQWCIKNAPYFLSYATYVSATIHVRATAHEPHGEAYSRLQNCLEILSEHQKVCHAPRRAMANLLLVIQRLKVDVGSISVLTSRTSLCDTTGTEVSRSQGLIQSSKESKVISSPRGNPTGPASTAGIASLVPGDSGQAETDAAFSQLDSFGNFDLDVSEVPDWMSFFDLDPIFGFNDLSYQA